MVCCGDIGCSNVGPRTCAAGVEAVSPVFLKRVGPGQIVVDDSQ